MPYRSFRDARPDRPRRRSFRWESLVCLVIASCTPSPGAEVGQLFWSEPGGVYRSDVDGSNRKSISHGFQVEGIAVSSQLEQLAWSDLPPTVPIGPSGIVSVSGLDGSSSRVVARNVPHPAGVVIDPIRGNIYWTDLESNEIRKTSVDGTGSELVLASRPDLTQMTGLAMDEQAGDVYFSYVNPLIDGLFPGGIARMNRDGTDLRFIVGGLVNPNGIAIDSENGLLFWADQLSGTGGVIGRAKLDGTESVQILSDLNSPFGIAIDSSTQHVFWTDTEARSIGRATFDGQDVAEILTDLDQPHALAFVLVPEPTTRVLSGLAIVVLAALRGRSRSSRYSLGGCYCRDAIHVFLSDYCRALVSRSGLGHSLTGKDLAPQQYNSQVLPRSAFKLPSCSQFEDFVALADAFGGQGGWATGDFDGDGIVQFPDFVLLADNFGKSVMRAPLVEVPEPSGFSLALIVGFVLIRRTRTKTAATPSFGSASNSFVRFPENL